MSRVRDNEDGNRERSKHLLTMGQIAAGIAHEVKNPLTTVKGFVQMLREKYPDQYFEIVELELDNALSTLQEFLKVTKPESDDEGYQEVNVAFEMESVLNLFRDRMYQVSVVKEFRDTTVNLHAKRNQLNRALFNLLKNAFESISDKGIIRLQHYLGDGELIVSIEDTGAGMDEQHLALLGTPFFTTKSEGTGMGLSQVYSTVYSHGGQIRVESTKGLGTKFEIFLPITKKEESQLTELDVVYSDDLSLRNFLEVNEESLRQSLQESRPELTSELRRIKAESGVDFVENAITLVKLTLANHPHELAAFATSEGRIWAKHSLQISLKLEWIGTIRTVLWSYIYNYYRVQDTLLERSAFFQLERNINSTLDAFLTHFTISYNEFKDELLQSQRELVEDLSVPIIPLTTSISILPLIGTIDTFRAATVQDKVLGQIEREHIESLIVDLSGVTFLDTAVLNHLFHLFEGVEMMGCKVIVTGIRAEVASVLVKTGLSIDVNIIKKGTLQQALEFIDARQ